MRSLGPLLLPLLLLSGCDNDGTIQVPARTFAVALHDPGATQTVSRSQPAGQHSWSGRSNETVFVQMTAPVTASATVTAADALAGSPDEMAVWLDGAGELGDIGYLVDSSGSYLAEVLPSTYDVLVAPDALLGRLPSRLITPVTFGSTPEAAPLDWTLPELALVEGRVVTWQVGEAVPGAIVTVFRASEPRLPLGVTVTSDSDGVFGFEVPEGRYDLVISSPSDGSRAIPTVRLLDQQLPLFPGLQLRAEVPVVPVVPVRGRLVRAGTDVGTAGRLRLVGALTDLAPGGTGIRMGRHRVEIETQPDGSWEVELPLGQYEASAFPRYSALPNIAPGAASFEVPFGVAAVDGVEIAMPPTPLVRIEARNPDGTAMVGATLNLRMTSPPRYSFRFATGEGGVFLGTLIPDRYDVELVPPLPADGVTRTARVQTQAQLGSLSGGTGLLVLTARRSDRVQGLVFTEGELPVNDVRVELRDPETGALWDATTTRVGGADQGVFEGVLPR